MNQEIEKKIHIWATYMQEHWSLFFPIVMGAINNRKASSTGLSPFFFMHRYHNEPIKLVEERMVQDRARKDGETLAECFLERLQYASEWAQAAMAMAQEKQQHHHCRERNIATSKYDPCLLITNRELEMFAIVGLQTDNTLVITTPAFSSAKDAALQKANF
jgi:hypothetical protein